MEFIVAVIEASTVAAEVVEVVTAGIWVPSGKVSAIQAIKVPGVEGDEFVVVLHEYRLPFESI